jgi:hypothetical protein
MSNNKAREINSPLIEELINETTPEELAKIDTEMTNNKQQTAVGWYIIKRDEIEMKIRLKLICANEYEQELIKADEQAKEMERQQIINAVDDQNNYDSWPSSIPTLGAQYYNETYGGGVQ